MYFTAQSKKSGASTLILVFACLIGLVAQVSAHGLMYSPPTRLMQDVEDEALRVKMASDPTMKRPCGTGGYGPVTMYKPGEMMLFAFNVTITHPGDCFVQFNKHGDKDEGFYNLKELGECGKTLGLVTAFVQMPHEPCDKCTVRFSWDDDLGNSYLNCGDVQIVDPMMHKRKTRRSLKKF